MFEELVKRLRNLYGTDNIAEFAEAADAIEELSKPRWIPVTERLPEIKETVLAMVHWDDFGDTMMCYGCRYKTRWYLWNCVEGELLKNFTVTHWMPLPEPPLVNIPLVINNAPTVIPAESEGE